MNHALAQDQFQEQKDKLSQLADESCWGIKPIGVCPKAKHVVGALVWLREPSLIISTQSKKSQQSGSLNHSNLHFNEVEVLDNPAASTFHQAICSDLPVKTSPVYYVSQLDNLSWMKNKIEKNLPETVLASRLGPYCSQLELGAQGQCMKNWGALYPRIGYSITPSPVVASVISAVRAVSIATKPQPGHIATRPPFTFNMKEDKFQLVFPKQTGCIPVGENPINWDNKLVSENGQYTWFYWNWRLCCI